MSSTVSKVCKISSIVLGILCFFGGIVIGNVLDVYKRQVYKLPGLSGTLHVRL